MLFTYSCSQGAFSFVYKARSCDTGDVFALKKLYLQSAELQRSAETEIDSLKKFRHENIIKMIDYTFANESGKGQIALILLPFTPGGSLRDVINHQLKFQLHSKPKLMATLSQFLDVCRALSVLHTYSPAFVHRDIKPENILFNDKGRPLLIDFGSVAPADVPVNTRQEVFMQAVRFLTYHSFIFLVDNTFRHLK
jgi:serine/threonine protein kinase